MRLQGCVVGLCGLCAALSQEFHLHLQAASDHRVVLVETERQGFADVDLLAHELGDHVIELPLRRSPTPHRLELRNKPACIVVGNDNRIY